jgi:hypothetical protein
MSLLKEPMLVMLITPARSRQVVILVNSTPDTNSCTYAVDECMQGGTQHMSSEYIQLASKAAKKCPTANPLVYLSAIN